MVTFQRERPGERMLTVEEAQQRVLDDVNVLETETIALVDAAGRILREDVVAPRDLPPADNSAMDGYAVRYQDIVAPPVTLTVIDDIAAGRVPSVRVEKGTAARIMTGAPIPAGADTVVQVELTDAGSERVTIRESVPSGSNVRRRGDDMHAGQMVVVAGTPIGAAEIGVLASVRKREVVVGRRPVVAILATGDEIVDIDAEGGAGTIVNSNSYSLAALAREAGAEVRLQPIVRDTLAATTAAIEAALDADFVVSSGGVSAGAFDFVKDALDALGGETRFWKIAMKPGKPVVFSRLRGRLYFGLPGNPVSCMVAFSLFVAPALKKAAGQREALLPPVVNMRVGGAMKSKGDRRTYMRVRVIARDGELVAGPMTSQGSHVATSMLGANAFAIMEAGVTAVAAGDMLPVLLIRNAYSG